MPPTNRIICLSNVFDQHYHDVRRETISRSLHTVKRGGLFRCLEMASGAKVIVLSAPAKALQRRSAKWLPAVETKFSTFPQFFCCNWDVPKLRIPLLWIFYSWHVARHTRTGDIVVIDNYEFIYVVAACFARLFRRVTFVLDYEDGKHLIDRSWARVLSGFAECVCRRMIRGAILVHPEMKNRLPPGLPTTLVPGFVAGTEHEQEFPTSSEIRFLYSGTLDEPRGVDILLKALEYLPDSGWRLDITGTGPLVGAVEQAASSACYAQKISFHKTLPEQDYQRLVAAAHVGLNCQRSFDPISAVTFPSKVFTYLSAGLVVLSSTASEVKLICGKACVYFDEETPKALAAAMNELIRDFSAVKQRLDVKQTKEHYSFDGTAARLREFLRIVNLPR